MSTYNTTTPPKLQAFSIQHDVYTTQAGDNTTTPPVFNHCLRVLLSIKSTGFVPRHAASIAAWCAAFSTIYNDLRYARSYGVAASTIIG
jgi:hypothetical protein